MHSHLIERTLMADRESLRIRWMLITSLEARHPLMHIGWQWRWNVPLQIGQNRPPRSIIKRPNQLHERIWSINEATVDRPAIIKRKREVHQLHAVRASAINSKWISSASLISSVHTKHVSQRREKASTIRWETQWKCPGTIQAGFLLLLVRSAGSVCVFCKVHNFLSRNNEKIHQKIKRSRAGPREAPLIVGWRMDALNSKFSKRTVYQLAGFFWWLLTEGNRNV